MVDTKIIEQCGNEHLLGDSVERESKAQVSSFRRILPQFLSCWAGYFISWNIGLTFALPTIVVPAVIGLNKHLNPSEMISMSADQASWLAGILFIIQPLGNVISSILNEAIGRKSTILLIGVVPMIAWTILAMSNSSLLAFAGFAVLGLGVGLTSAPMTYIGEICEPSVRGSLMSIAGITGTIGTFMVLLLGAFLPWRQVAFICLIIPFLNICVALFIPEAPIWLIAKDRLGDARNALRCLRGGVSSEAISIELEALQQIQAMSQICQPCDKIADECKHKDNSSNIWEKCRALLQMNTLKPLTLIVILLFFMQFCALFGMRPYMVQILQAHAVPLDANMFTTILGVIGILANVFNVAFIRRVGKRNIYLYSQIGNAVTCFGLSLYGFKYFPFGWTSSDDDNRLTERSLEYSAKIPIEWSYVVLIMFVIMQFCVCVGVTSIPYYLIIEVFPFKSRSFCCGLSCAINQIFAFISAKTYYDLERCLSLPGVLSFYGVLAAIGFLITYLIMPETEHRSLEDIELHYSDDSKPITDIHIRIGAATTENQTANNLI